MKTKSPAQIALAQARDAIKALKLEHKQRVEAVRQSKQEIVSTRERIAALTAQVSTERSEVRAAKVARAETRKQATIAKLEAKLAKARARAEKPVGVRKSKLDRKPGAVKVIKGADLVAAV